MNFISVVRDVPSVVTPGSRGAGAITAFFLGHIAILLFILVCSAGSICSIARVQTWGNALSEVDAYSEANALREVRNFLEQGLTRYQGLGNVYHPGMYPSDGFARDPADAEFALTPEGVYTHYPPGPEYLIYASARVLGAEPVWRLRLLPIAVGWAAMLYLGFALRHRFGPTVAWLVMGVFALTPVVADGFVGLHYQGYAAALLMVQIGIAIGVGTSYAPFLVLGFLQGWLSFDYVFLVTLVPLALELAMPRIETGYKPRWNLALWRACLVAAGFAIAHGLHFLQVWAYFGSLGDALRDLSGAAAHRAGAGMITGPIDYLAGAARNLMVYFYGFHPVHFGFDLPEPATPEVWSMFRFLGLSLGPWWLAISLILMVADARSGRSVRNDWYYVCLIGALTSSMWFLAMISHGFIHRHFLYRHLFFAFFLAVLFGAVKVSRYAMDRYKSQHWAWPDRLDPAKPNVPAV